MDKISGVFKILRFSAVFVLAVAAVSVVYAFITHGRFWPAYIFSANFAVGAFLIGAGIVLFAVPTSLRKKDNPLLDITTHAEMHIEAKAKKRERAYLLIYTGICNIVITVVAQYMLSLIWR